MNRLLLLVAFLLALVLGVFGAQNPQPVAIRFFGLESGAVPLSVVMLLSVLVGVSVSTLIGLRGYIRTTLRLRQRDRQIADLQQQLGERSKAKIVDVGDAPAGETSPAVAPGAGARTTGHAAERSSQH